MTRFTITKSNYSNCTQQMLSNSNNKKEMLIVPQTILHVEFPAALNIALFSIRNAAFCLNVSARDIQRWSPVLVSQCNAYRIFFCICHDKRNYTPWYTAAATTPSDVRVECCLGNILTYELLHLRTTFVKHYRFESILFALFWSIFSDQTSGKRHDGCEFDSRNIMGTSR